MVETDTDLPLPPDPANDEDFPDSTDSNIRYAAYASRLRTIAMTAHRYVAYTSDIGESFRPIFPASIVKVGYGISWLYILGDVSYITYRAKLKQEGYKLPHNWKPWDELSAESKVLTPNVAPDWKMVGLERLIFQSVASMGLPAFTIHSLVKHSGKWFNKHYPKNAMLRTWAPITIGLSVVPLLPFAFDKPIEHFLAHYVFPGNHKHSKLE